MATLCQQVNTFSAAYIPSILNALCGVSDHCWYLPIVTIRSDVLLWKLCLILSHMQWNEGTALISASMGGHLDVVKELLKAQANVNVQDKVCIVSIDS